jgi:hypothetical protein
MFFFAEYIPGDSEPHAILMIRAERNGEPIEARVRAVGGRTTTDYSYHMACFRFVYYDFDNMTRIEITDMAGTVLATIPRSQLSQRDRVTVDVGNGTVTNGISFVNYFVGMIMDTPAWIILSFVLVILLYITGLVSVSAVRMVMSAFKTYPEGCKRTFSGTYPHFIFCIFVSGSLVVAYFSGEDIVTELMEDYDLYAIPFIIAYIAGTILYPFAYRSFDGEEERYNRKIAQARAVEDTNTFTYTETTYSDGTRSDNYLSTLIGRNLGLLIFWVVKMFLAPLFAYHAMVKNYLLTPDPNEGSYTPMTSSGGGFTPFTATDGGASGFKFSGPLSQNAGPEIPMRQTAFEMEELVFARWSDAGDYYAGLIKGSVDNHYNVAFFDGDSAMVGSEYIVSAEYAIGNMNFWANWETGGTYYRCKLIDITEEYIRVRYDDDGVYENVGLAQLRAVMR